MLLAPSEGEIVLRSEIALLLLCGLPLVSGGCDRRSASDGQGSGNATALPANAAAPTSGEAPASPTPPENKGGFSAKIDKSHAGDDAPDFIFSGPDDKDVALTAFKGKPLLVNLWATWCGPCVAEMPTLDHIADSYGKSGLVVLTVSQDTGEAATVAAFFKKNKLPHLKLYRDPENQLGFHYATGLLPTTVLYSREGKEVARVTGAMDWSGKEAAELIEDALN